jgi:hypothetical protein
MRDGTIPWLVTQAAMKLQLLYWVAAKAQEKLKWVVE